MTFKKKSVLKEERESKTLRMYEYRLYPTKQQQKTLLKQFSVCKEFYNYILGENEKYGFLGKIEFNSLLQDVKCISPKYSQVHSQVLQNVSDRVAKAFENFFARCKKKKEGKKIKAGFPRFKSKISSITYPQSGFNIVSDKKIYASKIGNISVVLHRQPIGKIKTLTIKQNKANQWFAVFSCEQQKQNIKHPHSEKVIGIDVGIKKFLTDELGKFIPNPRYYLNSERSLKRLSRKHSRCVKGSNRREKSRLRLARQHLKVSNQRNDFQHKLSNSLTKENGTICGEILNIKNMVLNHNLAKHIHDVAWAKFYNMVTYKAVNCGGQLLKNPKTRGSSQRCSKCHKTHEMPLSERWFVCPYCGFECERDQNSSINHIKDTVGLTEINTPVEILPLPSHLRSASRVKESGTIFGS